MNTKGVDLMGECNRLQGQQRSACLVCSVHEKLNIASVIR